MKEKYLQLPYEEPRMENVLLNGSDIVTASGGESTSEENWSENLPSNGWV